MKCLSESDKEKTFISINMKPELKIRLNKLAKMDVLVIDDWGVGRRAREQDHYDLLEVLEDRHGNRSTIMTSQLPPNKWHESLGDPTVADAICDRVLHNAHRIALKGPSRRKEAGSKKK